MVPSVEQLEVIIGQSLLPSSAVGVRVALLTERLAEAASTNLNRLAEPNQLAHFIPQLLHESGCFQFLSEIWGPTDAQKRYDPPNSKARELGNTEKGDGYKYRGRDFIELTGKSNYHKFYLWLASMVVHDCPDFVANPDKVIDDKYLGYASIWYWGTHGCIPAADTGSVTAVTKAVNGGTNGLEERLAYYDRAAMVFLGYKPTSVKLFQQDAGFDDKDCDGIIGPQTRDEFTRQLKAMWTGLPVATPVASADLTDWLATGQLLHAQLGAWLNNAPKG